MGNSALVGTSGTYFVMAQLAAQDFHASCTFTTVAFTDTSSATASVDVALDHVGVSLVQPSLWLESGSSVSICWDSLPGGTYQVEYSEDFSSEVWTSLGSVVSGDGNTVRVHAPVHEPQCRYFRVVRIP